MLKVLRDDGFRVTAFERRSRVAGLWSYSDNTTYTTALSTTEANISKYPCGFADFPIHDSKCSMPRNFFVIHPLLHLKKKQILTKTYRVSPVHESSPLSRVYGRLRQTL